jgi:hypothetical protein
MAMAGGMIASNVTVCGDLPVSFDRGGFIG